MTLHIFFISLERPTLFPTWPDASVTASSRITPCAENQEIILFWKSLKSHFSKDPKFELPKINLQNLPYKSVDLLMFFGGNLKAPFMIKNRWNWREIDIARFARFYKYQKRNFVLGTRSNLVEKTGSAMPCCMLASHLLSIKLTTESSHDSLSLLFVWSSLCSTVLQLLQIE